MIALGLLATLSTLPLAGQETTKERQPLPEKTPYRVWVNGEDMTPRLGPMMQRRARLGVSVSLEQRSSDSVGAYIQSVTPGGPAAKAGLKSGDIITRLDGKSLLPDAGTRTPQGESAPGLRLIELAAKLEPKDTVKIEYLRDGARKTVALVTGDEPLMTMEDPEGRVFMWRTPMGEEREFRMPGMTVEPRPEGRVEIRRTPGTAMFFSSGPLGDIELAPLNPDLGSYFGATEGILVIKSPASSSLGLKGGDVVLSVDGRKPSSPSSLIRILRSYEPGDTFKLEVLRQKKKETITGKLEGPGREE
jgi:membrane-associated protease RseP (regulator of RpoE activity)